MRSATTSLPGHPSSVPQARRWTVATLGSWGLEVTAWTAAQVVSELATNSTLHARSAFSVGLTLEGECVRVEVADGVAGGLHARQYSATATTGRGLRIVEGLSLSWGVEATGNGKTVWALLSLPDAVRVPGDGDDAARPERGAAPSAVPSAGDVAPAGPRVQAAA